MDNDINNDKYRILRRRGRVSMLAGEMSKEDILQLEQTQMSSEYDYLNQLLDSQSEKAD